MSNELKNHSQQTNVLSLTGAIAGILAAIIAIVAAVFASYLYFERNYVKKNNKEIKIVIDKYQKDLDSLLDVQATRIDKFNKESLNIRDQSEIILEALKAYKRVGSSIADENKEFRMLKFTSGLGPNDETDKGQIISRVHKFQKVTQKGIIRIGYTDNFRVTTNQGGTGGKACRWEIKIDGKSCKGGKLIYDRYSSSSNIHASGHIIGYCDDIEIGGHEIQVWAEPHPSNKVYSDSNCYTGWNESRWTIETGEIFQ